MAEPIHFNFLFFLLFCFEDSFHSLPTSYQLLTSSKDYNKGLNSNGERERVLSPLLKTFPYNQNWQQCPSSDSNLPRFRRDVLNSVVENPKIETNCGSSNAWDLSQENRKPIN